MYSLKTQFFSWRLFYMQGNSDGPTDGKFKYAQVSFEREEEGGVYMMSLTGSSAEMVSFEIFETKE